MRTARAAFLLVVLLNVFVPRLPAQQQAGARKDIYHDGWIDLNKNGRKDVYEDPSADIGARVEDLLSRMTLEEKTCQTATLYGFGRVLQDELPTPEVYPEPIAFNVIGAAGSFPDGDDHTDEERKMMFETRKILEDDSIGVAVTCVRVPVRVCHSEAVNLQTREAISPEEVRELLAQTPGVVLEDVPTPLRAAGRDEVFVGRIRRDESHPRALSLWIVSDNLRKGAATNAVQIAEALVERGLLGRRESVAA